MADFLTKILMWLVPGWIKRNYISEDVLKNFFAHILNPKNVIFNWLIVRSGDLIHEREVRHYNDLMLLAREGKYDAELEFIRCNTYGKQGSFRVPMCPYERVKGALAVESGLEHGLPFVMHKKRMLFFPKSWGVDMAIKEYRCFVEEEGILGSGHLSRSPHSYITDSFMVEGGDILLDVGCAEGLFALDNVDVAAKIYLFESQRVWKVPLNATFKKYGNKVTIVNKLVARESSDSSIALSDALHNEASNAKYFIKMDIEGAEREVLGASESFLKSHRVKIACAAYHRQDDAEFLKEMMEKMGFSVRFSEGYVLPFINDFIYPYFRKGVIYARNY